jgi:hypothetical protein
MQNIPTKQIETALPEERRRPGRQEFHDPELIKLLRTDFDTPLSDVPIPDNSNAPLSTDVPVPDDSDGLAAAKGILLSIGAGAVSWVMLVGGGWWLWRLLT